MASPATNQRPAAGGQTKMCQFKLVLLGESAVGKSSLVLRFVKGQFHEYQESTIGGMCLYVNYEGSRSDIWQMLPMPVWICVKSKKYTTRHASIFLHCKWYTA